MAAARQGRRRWWGGEGSKANNMIFDSTGGSMRDLEVAKNTLPISIWGVPVRKWAGRVEYSHMGSPRFRIEFVSIWGLTYIARCLT
jgi:hypothetical protein